MRQIQSMSEHPFVRRLMDILSDDSTFLHFVVINLIRALVLVVFIAVGFVLGKIITAIFVKKAITEEQVGPITEEPAEEKSASKKKD